jgi:predicted AlkP superfamily phosphohydrolase/phosphomutase
LNTTYHGQKLDRREFLKVSAATTAALTTGLPAEKLYAAERTTIRPKKAKKVIVIGIDGMDPNLSEQMMNAGQLPNFNKLRKLGGYRRLRTSIPPQSPVAWANFINGAGPGSHGIFDFIHRNPKRQCAPFYSGAPHLPGEGYWNVSDYKLQLTFWPFDHKPPETLLGRKGVPFWDYLDEAGISSDVYYIPSNYPPSPSKYGNHRCFSGMGTPDLLQTHGTYQHYSTDGPFPAKNFGGGRQSCIFFENNTARTELVGPQNTFLQKAKSTSIPFLIHRDTKANAALIEIQDQKILLKQGQYSDWVKVDYRLTMPAFMPDEHLNGICRFYLQKTSPNFRLYVSPINIDPSDPAVQISEPAHFVEEMSDQMGLFHTTGFQEAYKARIHNVFTDKEYAAQSEMILQERIKALQFAQENYKDGLLFFYFSSTDLQSHMFWWNSSDKHPIRSDSEVKKCFAHIKKLYRKIDRVMGKILKRYGREATIIAMSDHGFATFRRRFNLNTWLRNNGYLQPAYASSVLKNADWSATRAYGIGLNGLYLNLKGRERKGIVEFGTEREQLLQELIDKLQAIRDTNGKQVIHKVHRTDRVYAGPETPFAPDLIIGYAKGYRASWATTLGDITEQMLWNNILPWSADHCVDVSQVPGILFCNKSIRAEAPALVDLAPSIMAEYGLKTPHSMTGKNIFAT